MRLEGPPTESSKPIDVTANRKTRKWSRREQAGRIIWALAQPLFALSPRPFWGWRRMILRLFGARIGQKTNIYPSVRITIPWNLDLGDYCAIGDRAILYALGPISIGSRTTISQGAHLCAGSHDVSRPDRPLVKAPITVASDVWIAADAFIGPNVNIGRGAIAGARSVVVRDVDPGCVVVGNPARIIRKL